MALSSFSDVLTAVLKRADEDSTDVNGDWYDETQRIILEVWRELYVEHPWLDLVSDPPAAFVTSAAVTSLTLTIAAAGTGVAGTLSATYATSLAGYKIRPTGKNWLARITAHTAGTATLTLDAVPETVAAGTACTIFKDEYDLASDLGVFVDGLWNQDGSFCFLVSEEELKAMYSPLPGASNTPRHFCRLTASKIRFGEYPTSARRFEYPYVKEPADPSGSSALALGKHVLPALLHKSLSILYGLKSDKREATADKRGERLLEKAMSYERRRKTGLGVMSNRVGPGAYNDVSRYGGYGV